MMSLHIAALIPINMEFIWYKSQTSLVWLKQPLACSYTVFCLRFGLIGLVLTCQTIRSGMRLSAVVWHILKSSPALCLLPQLLQTELDLAIHCTWLLLNPCSQLESFLLESVCEMLFWEQSANHVRTTLSCSILVGGQSCVSSNHGCCNLSFKYSGTEAWEMYWQGSTFLWCAERDAQGRKMLNVLNLEDEWTMSSLPSQPLLPVYGCNSTRALIGYWAGIIFL